jgi:hypothetical protein
MDTDEHFIVASSTFSPIGVGAILERIDSYVTDVKISSEKIGELENGDASAIFHISSIRERSVEMLNGMELLKASLDRYICADEDVNRPKLHRETKLRRTGKYGRRSRRSSCNR